MPGSDLARRVDAVRHFNRFYTQRIGVLEDDYQRSALSLAEARVLYELIHRDKPAPSAIARDLGLDNGYLSRILRGFEKDGLVRREASKSDGRQSLIVPTAKAQRKYEALEAATRDGIGTMLRTIPETEQERAVAAMTTIRAVLAPDKSAHPFVLRSPVAGDYGWIVQRHGALYAQEYDWTDPRFEGLCAKIVSDFIAGNDPARERCWIAERNGENAGSIFLVKDSEQVARIRLLLVEPSARGYGIGQKLTAECIGFARAAGYRKLTLWTHSVLTGARRIYQRAGFKLTGTKPHNDWGKAVVGETWDLKL